MHEVWRYAIGMLTEKEALACGTDPLAAPAPVNRAKTVGYPIRAINAKIVGLPLWDGIYKWYGVNDAQNF